LGAFNGNDVCTYLGNRLLAHHEDGREAFQELWDARKSGTGEAA
jgi:hypothetical protein